MQRCLKDRSNKQVEHLIRYCKKSNYNNNRLCRTAAGTECQIMNPGADAVAPAQQNQKKNNERARKHQIGNAAPPPAPRAVAGGADNRIDDEIQQRRKTPDQKPDRKIVGIVESGPPSSRSRNHPRASR